MNLIIRWLCPSFVLLVFVTAQAATLTGRVVGIQDGDTITVLDANREQHKIRLAGIDAPEAKQAYGSRSKQNLSSLIYNRQVTVEWNKHDRYGRKVGVILIDSSDVNLEQVRAGMAWWYRDYAKEQKPDDRQLYEQTEKEARRARRGLWAEADPTPPWEWRRKR